MSQPQALGLRRSWATCYQQVASGLRSEQRKDAGSADIGNIGPTEDAAMRRFAAAAPPPPACTRQPYVQARGNWESTI